MSIRGGTREDPLQFINYKTLNWYATTDAHASAGFTLVDGCFFKCSDDGVYYAANRDGAVFRRTTFWNWSGGASFLVSAHGGGKNVLVEDCDIIRNRAYDNPVLGNPFGLRSLDSGVTIENIHFKDIRIEHTKKVWFRFNLSELADEDSPPPAGVTVRDMSFKNMKVYGYKPDYSWGERLPVMTGMFRGNDTSAISDIVFENIQFQENANGWHPSETADWRQAERNEFDLDSKESVRAATTGNISLSGLQTVDGVALQEGDRVLVKDQDDAKTNGIYTVKDGASWSRAGDFDSTLTNAAIPVAEGTSNEGRHFQWVPTTSFTIDSTDMEFVENLDPNIGEVFVQETTGETLPVGWLNRDIALETVSIAPGSAGYEPPVVDPEDPATYTYPFINRDGTFTVTGAGNISGNADKFQMVYKRVETLNGATTVSAGVHYTDGTAGIMLRQTLDPKSPQVSCVINGDQINLVARSAGGKVVQYCSTNVPSLTPGLIYLKIERTSNTSYKAQYATASAPETWNSLTPVFPNTDEVISLPDLNASELYFGLVSCSEDNETTKSTTFTAVKNEPAMMEY